MSQEFKSKFFISSSEESDSVEIAKEFSLDNKKKRELTKRKILTLEEKIKKKINECIITIEDGKNTKNINYLIQGYNNLNKIYEDNNLNYKLDVKKYIELLNSIKIWIEEYNDYQNFNNKDKLLLKNMKYDLIKKINEKLN